MGNARLQRLALLIFASFELALVGGCGGMANGKCISVTMTFTGIGSLATVPQGPSQALAVAVAPVQAFGSAADHYKSFDPGSAAIGWARAGTTPPLLHGTGMENLGYQPDAELANPVAAIARGVTGDGRIAVGSTTSKGGMVPVRWGSVGSPELLPVPAAAVTGEALAGGTTGMGPSFFAGGYVSSATGMLGDHSPRQAVVWVKDLSFPLAAISLTPPDGPGLSSQVNAVGGSGILATPMEAMGEEYQPGPGRTATVEPCVWTYRPNPVFPSTPGTWSGITLNDVAGAVTRGSVTCSSPEADALGGCIAEKVAVFKPCRWPRTTSGWGNAQRLPTIYPPDEAHVTGIGEHHELTVGYELTPSGSVAVVWVGGAVHPLADFLNAQQKNTVPAGWTLTEATSIQGRLPVPITTPNPVRQMAIAGFGNHDGRVEGWVVEISEDALPWYTCFLPRPTIWPIRHDKPFPWLPVLPPSHGAGQR